jgi:hypothetical protein
MIPFPIKVFVRGSLELGFSSVMHNENLTYGVNYKSPYVRLLWALWSCGRWSYTPSGAYEIQLCHLILILCPRTKFSLCP